MKGSRAGFTLLEMLVILSIMGIFFGLGTYMLRPSSAYLFTNDLKAMIQQARYEAIKRNIPVAVVWNNDTQTFTTRFNITDPTLTQACSGTTILNTKRLTEYYNMSVQTPFAQNGLVWLPSGLGAQCGGGLMMNSTTLTDGRVTYSVTVSSAGRVRIVKAP